MLRLRPYKKCDARYIVSWTKNEIDFRKWCADIYKNYPITEDDINEAYENLDEDWECIELAIDKGYDQKEG